MKVKWGNYSTRQEQYFYSIFMGIQTTKKKYDERVKAVRSDYKKRVYKKKLKEIKNDFIICAYFSYGNYYFSLFVTITFKSNNNNFEFENLLFYFNSELN
jgi:hypothetical protein